MARKLPELGAKTGGRKCEVEWVKPQPESWARKRLLVVRLIAQHEPTVAQIMRVVDVSRQTVFTYRDTVMTGGVEALLARSWAPCRARQCGGAVADRVCRAGWRPGSSGKGKDAQVCSGSKSAPARI